MPIRYQDAGDAPLYIDLLFRKNVLNGRTLHQTVLHCRKVLQFLHRIAPAQSPDVEHQQIGISDRILIREPAPPPTRFLTSFPRARTPGGYGEQVRGYCRDARHEHRSNS
jgi:hypothetical protein